MHLIQFNDLEVNINVLVRSQLQGGGQDVATSLFLENFRRDIYCNRYKCYFDITCFCFIMLLLIWNGGSCLELYLEYSLFKYQT